MHSISLAIEKNKKHETGDAKKGSNTMEEFYRNKFKKDMNLLEDKRL
jgi:hypothetical protein